LGSADFMRVPLPAAMTTTLSAMRLFLFLPRVKRAIIGALLACLLPVLVGCSTVRLGYANAPQLAWWWLDGYVDFSAEQAPQVKQALERWFTWHRATQLPAYVALLGEAQAQITQPTTPAALCQWQVRLEDALDPAYARALADFAELVPGLGEPQLRAIAKRYAKNLEEMRDKYLQADRAERRREAVQRAVEGAEQIYGTLDDAQTQLIAAGVAASPFNPELWLAHTQARQRDTLAVLRRLLAERADRAQRVSALRALADRSLQSRDPGYASYQRALRSYNCAFAARIHNATHTTQREHARDKLKGWQEDLRALLSAPT
jgi:hypothetical protein